MLFLSILLIFLKTQATPLIISSMGGFLEAVMVLLCRGANLNAVDQVTLLSQRKETKCFFFLTRHEFSSISRPSITPQRLVTLKSPRLSWSGKRVQTRWRRFFFAFEFFYDPQNRYTPLLIASQEGHEGVVEALLRHCATVDHSDEVWRQDSSQ